MLQRVYLKKLRKMSLLQPSSTLEQVNKKKVKATLEDYYEKIFEHKLTIEAHLPEIILPLASKVFPKKKKTLDASDDYERWLKAFERDEVKEEEE
jgi:hypothetical protein